MMQGGTSTGRGVRDTCDTAVPPRESRHRGRHSSDPRGVTRAVDDVGSRTRVLHGAEDRRPGQRAVPVAERGQCAPGSRRQHVGDQRRVPQREYAVPNAVVQASLGRLPGVGLVKGTTAVNLLSRASSILTSASIRLTCGSRRSSASVGSADIGVDLYNLFNTNDATAFQQSFDLQHGTMAQRG